jgi:hypothetical protein
MMRGAGCGRGLPIAAVLAVALAAVAARADEPPAVDLDVVLDPGASRIVGHVRLRVVNHTGLPIREVPLWLYPNQLARRSAGLTDVSYHWLYPGWFSPAHIDVGAVRADGRAATVSFADSAAGERTVAWVGLPTDLAAGAAITLDADFTTRMPHRFGGFGCVGPRCRAMGGFYPMPAAQKRGGFDLAAAPTREGRVRVALRAPKPLALVVDGRPVVWPGSDRTVTVDSADVPYATIVTDRVLRPETITVGGHVATYLHANPRPPDSEALPLPYVREDAPGLVLATVRRALQLADAVLGGPGPAGATGSPEAGAALSAALTLVEAPLRHQMVQVHGRVILVSDQIFNIFPLQRLRKYHQIELARAVLTALADARLGAVDEAASRYSGPDRDLAAAVMGIYLADLYAEVAFKKVEYARDILRPYDFVPAVDQLIYAPLLPSASTYFGDVGDSDPIRDDLRLMSRPNAPGPRLVYSKLLDLIGANGFSRLAAAVLRDGRPFAQAAAEIFGADLSWFWRQWLGALPRVNYHLAGVRVVPAPGGDGSHVVVDVSREGAAVREPCEVRIVDRSGAEQILIWDDAAATHRFELDLPTGLKSVEIDPRDRLVETALGSLKPSDDPRYDNGQPTRWRLLYEGFGALLNVSTLTANFEAAFLLKPQHDLRHAILMTAFHSESVDIGAGAAYFWNFGPQADKNSLQSSLFGGVDVSRINPSFGLGAGDRGEPGLTFSGRVSVAHDSRDFLYDPWHAIGASAAVGYSLTALDSGEKLSQVAFGVEALRLIEMAPGHVLALDAGAAATFGDIRLPAQLTAAGGPAGLRGFMADELLARANARATIQLRDDYISGLSWNLMHLTTVRGFAGTVFADAAAISTCDDYGFSTRRIFSDVGYSFRVLHDAFGVYQQLLSIDLAVPLDRRNEVGTCLGRPVPPFANNVLTRERVRLPFPDRPPFVIQVSFVPSF